MAHLFAEFISLDLQLTGTGFGGTRAGCESEIASLDPFFGEAQKFCVPLLMVRGSHHGRGIHIYVDHLGPRDHDFKIFLVEPDCL